MSFKFHFVAHKEQLFFILLERKYWQHLQFAINVVAVYFLCSFRLLEIACFFYLVAAVV